MAKAFKTHVAGVNGSAGTPAFSFESDPNTGIYSVSADVLGFSVAGSQAVSVSATGIEAVNDVRHRHGTSRSTTMMDLEVLSWM